MTALAHREDTGLLPPVLALVEHGILTPTAFNIGQLITLTGDDYSTLDLERLPEFRQWAAIGGWLGAFHRAYRWWVADWLNFGEGAWGERYAQAAEATGVHKDSLGNWAYTGRQVLPSRRQEGLSFTTHYVVAPLEPDSQVQWLKRAVEEQLDSRSLRLAIQESPGAPPPRPRPTLNGQPEQPPINPADVVAKARALWKAAMKDPAEPGWHRVPSEQLAQLGAALGVGG